MEAEAKRLVRGLAALMFIAVFMLGCMALIAFVAR
jgi:hypothetical protein